MDFFDSLDLNVSTNKSNRVQSWYLYEQYKSLERNQLDAVEKLKNKSYQDRILRLELSERKARRKLYNQHDVCPKKSSADHSIKSECTKSSLTPSSNDFFDSFCPFSKDEYDQPDIDQDVSEICSQDDSGVGKLCDVDEFQSIDESKNYACGGESAISAVEIKSDETIVDDLMEKRDIGFGSTIADDIHYHFDELTDDLECLEKYTVFKTDEAETDSYKLRDLNNIVKKGNDSCGSDNNVFAMWTKLVSFAYQIVQLNHGNCYYDYGSQFLTAVLACDVLRKGINKMCHILQPYVSPIKFATDSDVSVKNHKSVKRKKCTQHRKCNKLLDDKFTLKHFVQSTKECSRKYHSEKCWHHCSNTFDVKKERRISEPLRIQKCKINSENFSIKSSCNNLQKMTNNFIDHSEGDVCGCNRVLNPMLKLSEYLDSIMKEVDDSKFV